MNWLKQNWIKVGVGILIFATLFFIKEKYGSLLNASLVRTPRPLASPELDIAERCKNDWKRARSPKSSDSKLIIEIDNEKLILTVKTDKGEVFYQRNSDMDIFNPVFSLDNTKIYYIKPDVRGIFELNLANSNERRVTEGNSVMIIPRGEYKGNLIIEKHKYFRGGGSYDFYWVVDPDTGEEIDGPILYVELFFDSSICGAD